MKHRVNILALVAGLLLATEAPKCLGQLQPGASNAVRYLDEETELIRVEMLKKPLTPFEYTLPAELDPLGNWGGVVEGIQISLRFEKEKYLSTEPVIGFAKIRNVGTQSTYFWHTAPSFLTREIIVINDNNQVLPRTDIPTGNTFRERSARTVAYAGRLGVNPGRQLTVIFNLHEMFDLSTNGEYIVYCRQKVPSLSDQGGDWTDSFWVQSGNASIRIEGGKPGSVSRVPVTTNRVTEKTTPNQIHFNSPAKSPAHSNNGGLNTDSLAGSRSETLASSRSAGNGEGANDAVAQNRHVKYGLLTLTTLLLFIFLFLRARKKP